jgi:hypothetical protein
VRHGAGSPGPQRTSGRHGGDRQKITRPGSDPRPGESIRQAGSAAIRSQRR